MIVFYSDPSPTSALGAHAVLVGRPIIWGLAVNGSDGVVHVLEMFRNEFEQAMALVGCSTLTTINPSFVRRIAFGNYRRS